MSKHPSHKCENESCWCHVADKNITELKTELKKSMDREYALDNNLRIIQTTNDELRIKAEVMQKLLNKEALFNDIFMERFFHYIRHLHGCTYDQLDKGDVCTCGFQGLVNLYYEIKDAIDD